MNLEFNERFRLPTLQSEGECRDADGVHLRQAVTCEYCGHDFLIENDVPKLLPQ